MAVLRKLITSSYSNQTLQVFWAYPARLEQLLLISAGDMWGAPSEFSPTLHLSYKKQQLLLWRYLVWNKPLITLFRVIWLDISLSGFIFTSLWLCENKLACSWNVSPYHTLTHVISTIYWANFDKHFFYTRKCSCSIGWASERSSGMRARLNDDVPY